MGGARYNLLHQLLHDPLKDSAFAAFRASCLNSSGIPDFRNRPGLAYNTLLRCLNQLFIQSGGGVTLNSTLWGSAARGLGHQLEEGLEAVPRGEARAAPAVARRPARARCW